MKVRSKPHSKQAASKTKKAAKKAATKQARSEQQAGAATGKGGHRYAAFLRGVSPMNAKMPELKRCFEAAGFTDVKTVLGSGNVVFSAPAAPEAKLAARAEAAMQNELGHSFSVIVRSVDALRKMLDADPFHSFRLAANAKRVVTFLKQRPKAKLATPLAVESARILSVTGSEAFTAYVPTPRGPVFMTLIEKTFGKDVTTRTWDTVKKVVVK